MKNFLLFSLFSCYFVFPLSAQDHFDIHNAEGLRVIQCKNDFLNAQISFDKQVELRIFRSRQDCFLFSESEKENGVRLILKKKSLKKDDDENYPLPERYSPRRKNEENTVIIDGVGKSPFRYQQVNSLNADKAILNQTTSITNRSDEKIVFYPTEEYPFHKAVAASERIYLPTDIYFYSKYDPQDAFQIEKKSEEKSPFNAIEEKELLYAHPDIISASLSYTSQEPWFVVQNGMNGRLMAIEYDFPNGKPQKDSYDVQLKFLPNESRKSFLIMKYCMGKVELEPGEVFTYAKRLSTNTCLGPVVSVDESVVYNREFGVMKSDMGFYLYGVMGFAQEGPVGCHFLDEDGKIVRKNYNISLVLNPLNHQKRPPYSDIDFPTIITHEVGFTFDEEMVEEYGENPLKAMYEIIKKVQLVLLDEQREKVIRVLAETKGPWEPFRQFEQEDVGEKNL